MMTRSFCSFVAIVSLFHAFSAYAEQPYVIGWVEKIKVESIGATLPAKMDTGAKTSSLDAEIIKLTDPKAKKSSDANDRLGSVVFGVTDEHGNEQVLERKIHRWVRIKSKTGGFLRRPVVKMGFCIADHQVLEEVNLSERGHFNYPILIGRNMIQKGGFAIDAARTYTVKPNCKPANKQGL